MDSNEAGRTDEPAPKSDRRGMVLVRDPLLAGGRLLRKGFAGLEIAEPEMAGTVAVAVRWAGGETVVLLTPEKTPDGKERPLGDDELKTGEPLGAKRLLEFAVGPPRVVP